MTKTFLLKGHSDNNDTVILVVEGKAYMTSMEQEKFLGEDFVEALYKVLPSATIQAMMDKFNELRGDWD